MLAIAFDACDQTNSADTHSGIVVAADLCMMRTADDIVTICIQQSLLDI